MSPARRVLAVLVVATSSYGCSATLQGVTDGLAAIPKPEEPTWEASASTGSLAPRLMLYGGEDHKTFLGCLNCSKGAADSVLNELGAHGSPHETASIFNQNGDYGSADSTYSACNPTATDPPVIVDRAGKSHGRLTVNTDHPQATRIKKYLGWIAGVCKRQG